MPRVKGSQAKSGGEWCDVFLATLRQTPIVKDACLAAGVHRTAAYQYAERYPWFREAWDAAKAEGLESEIDSLERAMFLRAQSKSDLLIIFALKNLKPDVYGDKARIDHTHTISRDDVATVLRAFVVAVKRHVTDPSTIQRIEQDFSESLRTGPCAELSP